MQLSSLGKQIIAWLVALLVIAALITAIVWLYKDRQQVKQEVTTLTDQVNTQSQTIALQSLDFSHFNQISQNVQSSKLADQATAKDSENEIIYDYKTVTVRDDCIPVATSDRLLKYANSLRTATMHPDQLEPDSSDTNPYAGSCLTYQNATVWLDRLLRALNDANKDKWGIREEEKKRQENYKTVTGSK